MSKFTHPSTSASTNASASQAQQYLGTWISEDRWVRHTLLPAGRYDEARGRREHAYRGSYRINGAHIDYVDDTGFTADGDFVHDDDGQSVLLHAGMVLRRRPDLERGAARTS